MTVSGSVRAAVSATSCTSSQSHASCGGNSTDVAKSPHHVGKGQQTVVIYPSTPPHLPPLLHPPSSTSPHLPPSSTSPHLPPLIYPPSSTPPPLPPLLYPPHLPPLIYPPSPQTSDSPSLLCLAPLPAVSSFPGKCLRFFISFFVLLSCCLCRTSNVGLID